MSTSYRKGEPRFGGLTVHLLKLPRLAPSAVVALALALLAFACAPAEEPTATPTSAPAVVAPTATTAPVTAEPTATPTVVVGGGRGGAAGIVGERPKITPEILDRLDRMEYSPTEVQRLFPSNLPLDYKYEDIKRGGIFRLALTTDISTFDHRKATGGGTTSITYAIYSGLVQYEQGPLRNPNDPAIVPDLCASWEYNGDGTQLTCHLEQGVHWGDIDDPFQLGPEIVADDIARIIPEMRDNSVHGGNYRTIESVEAPDKYTVVIHFMAPSFWFLPWAASKDAAMPNPYLWDAGRADFEVVGPGPFILTEAKKSIEVKFVRNPNYHWKDDHGNPLPYLDGMHYLIVPDVGTRVAMLRTGKVEFAATVAPKLETLIPLLRTNPDLLVSTTAGTGTGFSAAFNMNNPLFDDINLRRALTLATDGKAMSDVIYVGHGMPVDWTQWYFYRDTPPTWEEDLDASFGPYQNHHDPAKAKELYDKTGLGAMELKLTFFAYRQAYQDIASMMTEDLETLGITLRPKSLDYSTYNSQLLKGTFDEMTLGWLGPAYDPVAVGLIRMRSDSIMNRSKFKDQVIDDLVDQMVLAPTKPEQVALLRQIRDRYNDQVYWVDCLARAYSIELLVPPYVKGLGGGLFAQLNYYYQAKVLRQAWLDL